MFLWLESDGAFVFNLLPQADVKTEYTDVGDVYEQGHGHLLSRITTGTKPDVTEPVSSLGIGETTFLFFQQVDSALTSPSAQWRENMVWLRHRGRLRIH